MNLLIRTFLVLCIILVSTPNLLTKVEPTLNEIIKDWKAGDGAMLYELGETISYIYISQSDDFYKKMYCDKKLFNEWVEKLQYHTFTIYNCNDKKDCCKKEKELQILKKKMLIIANKFLQIKKYRNMSNALIMSLKKITIRFID